MLNGARIGVDMLLQGQALSALEAARILLGDSSAQQDRVCRVNETVKRGFAKLDDAKQIKMLEGLGRAQPASGYRESGNSSLRNLGSGSSPATMCTRLRRVRRRAVLRRQVILAMRCKGGEHKHDRCKA